MDGWTDGVGGEMWMEISSIKTAVHDRFRLLFTEFKQADWKERGRKCGTGGKWQRQREENVTSGLTRQGECERVII